MSQDDADTVIMLSSDLIAEVMETYFNKQMFKKTVKIVDLKPTETGYAFSLAFVERKLTIDLDPIIVQQDGRVFSPLVDTRDTKGRFTKQKATANANTQR